MPKPAVAQVGHPSLGRLLPQKRFAHLQRNPYPFVLSPTLSSESSSESFAAAKSGDTTGAAAADCGNFFTVAGDTAVVGPAAAVSVTALRAGAVDGPHSRSDPEDVVADCAIPAGKVSTAPGVRDGAKSSSAATAVRDGAKSSSAATAADSTTTGLPTQRAMPSPPTPLEQRWLSVPIPLVQ